MLTIITAAGWPIWPLLFISVIALAIILERVWFLRKSKISPNKSVGQAVNFSEKIRDNQPLDPNEIIKFSRSTPLAKILAVGLVARKSNLSSDQCVEQMRDAAAPIFVALNRYLSGLATISTIAPLMGLFGTVLGMIDIFSSQSGGVANPQQLAEGISMALYNTAFGLLIAIPAIAGWRWLRGLADDRQRECNEGCRLLLKHMYPST
ncbi:MAG: MotA/TolQ/ExbB proton channel family protein [Betaproteobacteria bacterium]|jgi:biopolymer transport protein ExbB